jgi:hypothetical protein
MGANSARDRVSAARFRFTDHEWKSIHKSLGGAQIDPAVRHTLEWAAEGFVSDRLRFFKLSAGEKKALHDIAKPAKLLLKNLDHLPAHLIGSLGIFTMARRIAAVTPSPGVIDEEEVGRLWAQMKSDLARLIRVAEGISVSLHPHNVDTRRNRLWRFAGQIYEQATGDTVGVSVPSDVGATDGGPFFRFITALMNAIPGASVPTLGQVRGWYRGDWKAKQRLRAGMASDD